MYQSISIKTQDKVGSLPLFSYRFKLPEGANRRSLTIIYGEDEHDCIVFTDSELPAASGYGVRGDGIWADAVEEVRREHWSLSLESFALRVPVDEYLAYKETREGLLIGDRIPFGYELDVIAKENGQWLLSGEILVEKNEFEFTDLSVAFTLK